MKSIIQFLFLIGITVTLLTACNKVSNSTTDSISLNNYPELLDRPELLQNGKEWDAVQNTYAASIQNLTSDKVNLESYLKLTEVCILEARVTVEHGHYYPGALHIIDELLNRKDVTKDVLFQALSLKSSVLLSQHDFENALLCSQRAIQLNPYNAQIYGTLTDALVELGQYEEAVKAADKMVSIRPDLRSYARISYLREIHGDIEGSIEAMKMAVKAGYPGLEQSAWTRLTLGNIYETYGKLDEAKNEYKLTLAERENYPFAIGALAGIELQQENYEAAEKLLNEAAAIIPEFSFYVQLAELYQKTDRTEEYKNTMEEIFVMLQDDVDSGHNMNLEYADIHLRITKDYKKALDYTLLEYEKRPVNIDVNKMLAKIYLKMGDSVNSKKYYNEAIRTNSKNPDIENLKEQLAMVPTKNKKDKTVF